ncbi:type IV pilin-like G/H family protein [Argonema galeatum]|uniref:type IV pilin-like G/H family protein n=1 Tax=Argonema galeatum TaxID=2942762 RepID=UPI002011DF06|nr:type IV pilin-like G/H family protein [Argonema galeatum]MCL1466809.1 type IV pilin-like G/H family protein [Argonema galeatum A003/A1]
MNTTFKTKLLLHLNQKKQQTGEQGFTLIELLVVIIIIGILAAIALPSFLNQANKGKQAEAKQYTSSVNKGQQAYYTEFGSFVTGTDDPAWNSLGVGIKTQTTNYAYKIVANAVQADVLATQNGDSLKKALKPYTGGVRLVGTGDKTTQAVVCEGLANTDPTTTAGGDAEGIKCGTGMTPLK